MEKGKIKDKGKLKQKRKYLSLIFIPDHANSSKALRISAHYTKVLAVLAVPVLILTGVIVFTVYSALHATVMNLNVSTLSNQNDNLKKDLDSKNAEIEQLKLKEQQSKKNLNIFTLRYKKIMDKYLSKYSPDSTTSRGDTGSSTITAEFRAMAKLTQSVNNGNSVGKDTLEKLAKIELALKKYDNKVKAVKAAERQKEIEAYEASIPDYWPAYGRLSSYFGTRSDPFNGSSRSHEGIDIAADYGNNIRAAGSGTVIFTGYRSGYGLCLMISHGNGLTTLYGHTSRILVSEGEWVDKGSIVAKVGSSGRSTGPHLHFEVHSDGTPVNPLKYLN